MTRTRRFNEAAGVPRGILTQQRRTQTYSTSFNEAAGVPRGIRTSAHKHPCSSRCFNEAAGVPRGIRAHAVRGHHHRLPASMRPREFPAESDGPGTLSFIIETLQ